MQRGESVQPNFERRTRLICHLPLNRRPEDRKPNQLYVVLDFIKFLKKSELHGFSMSSIMDTVFTGYWRARPREDFEEENVVIFMIDHVLDRGDPRLWAFADQIKREIQRLYKRYAGEKEDEIWIVAHSIDRLL